RIAASIGGSFSRSQPLRACSNSRAPARCMPPIAPGAIAIDKQRRSAALAEWRPCDAVRNMKEGARLPVDEPPLLDNAAPTKLWGARMMNSQLFRPRIEIERFAIGHFDLRQARRVEDRIFRD